MSALQFLVQLGKEILDEGVEIRLKGMACMPPLSSL